MDCFISYATEDIEVARRLFKGLTDVGISTFLAKDSLQFGECHKPIIQANVCRATVVILLDSEASRRSAPVQQEAGMALASGSLLIPVSLDGHFDRLPAWLADLQATEAVPGRNLEAGIAAVVDRVRRYLDPAHGEFPSRLLRPDTVADHVLKTVVLDQFQGPDDRGGAWSRQYERYLNEYWGQTKKRQGVSLDTSLTLTGMIVERLVEYLEFAPPETAQIVRASLQRAEASILSCQDQDRGGFGRRSAFLKIRTYHEPHLDLRHTCWAVRALLSIDAVRLRPVIEAALEWLARNARSRSSSDQWCWTTAPLLALLGDERALSLGNWSRARDKMLPAVRRDLEKDFSPSHGSWVAGEPNEKKQWVATDNALYVLYTLAGTSLGSTRLVEQTQAAVRWLLSKARTQGGETGLGLFTEAPEVGPTAHLLEILSSNPWDNTNLASLEQRRGMARFIVNRLSASNPMPATFSWHLSAALAVPSLRDHPLTPA